MLHAARGLPNGPLRRSGHAGPRRPQVHRTPALLHPAARRSGQGLACQLPAETGTPLSRWTTPELASEAVKRGIAPFLPASTVRRRLAQDAPSRAPAGPHPGARNADWPFSGTARSA